MTNFKKSILAGSCISLGAFIYLITLSKTNNPPVASIMFYLGLSLIMIFGLSLFTGQVLTLSNLPTKQYIKTLTITWIGNLIGSIITTIALNQKYNPDVSQLVLNKLSLNPIQLIVSAIFCNILVCSAVYSYRTTKNHIISAFFISCFVIMGFEHSIANMTYFTLGVLQGINFNIFNMLISIVLVTLGNFVGGRLVYCVINKNQQ